MAISVEVFRQDRISPVAEISSLQDSSSNVLTSIDTKMYAVSKPVVIFQERPIHPFEPAPWVLSAEEWEIYTHKKIAAEQFAKEELRGTF